VSTSFHFLLPRRIYEQMICQARAELPNECCGLLAATTANCAALATGILGDADRNDPAPATRTITFERCYPLVNAAASSVEYLSDARSIFDAARDMRKQDLEIAAIYHSHPTSAPIPSRTDRQRNYSEQIVNFIISLQRPEPEIRAWWLTAQDHREASWELVGG
jgi:proteasome lid subunit RPN8/RPN11